MPDTSYTLPTDSAIDIRGASGTGWHHTLAGPHRSRSRSPDSSAPDGGEPC